MNDFKVRHVPTFRIYQKNISKDGDPVILKWNWMLEYKGDLITTNVIGFETREECLQNALDAQYAFANIDKSELR